MVVMDTSEASSVCHLEMNDAVPSAFIIPVVITLMTLLLVIGSVILWVVVSRRRTKWQLEQRGIPTVLWRPRFMNYRPFEEDQKLSSTTITRILPRMERLDGPFGMYGTVYGVNIPVIHVAHPSPARAIFGSTSGASSTSSSSSSLSSYNQSSRINSRQQRSSSSVAYSTGASKAPAYNHFKNFCGDGVFTANGEDWKAKRAAVMHCLIKGTNSSTSEVSRRLEDEANRAADIFLDQIHLQQQQQVSGNETENDHVVTNVVPLLQRSTVGLIYRFITHHQPVWDKKQSPSPMDDTTETTSLSSSDSSTEQDSVHGTQEDDNDGISLLEKYLKSITRIRMIILAQSRSIWFVLPRWCYSTFSSMHQDEETTLLPIRQFSQEACQNAQPGSPLAKLQSMDSHNHRGIPSNTKVSKHLLDEAITLLFAGQDTSAATLSWTLHLLSIYPDIQTRLANEIHNVIGEQQLQPSERVRVSRSLIAKLPFLDAVIKESMRLYPVAPFVVRRLQNDITVEDDDSTTKTSGSKVTLPAGSTACIWIYSLHRNPKLWHRPNDFVPDRWLNGVDSKQDLGQTSGAYMPFAAGPRNCVGQPIAHVVLRTILARLVLAMEFRDERLEDLTNPEDLRIEMQAGFTVLPNGGVTVAVRPRHMGTSLA